MRVSSGTLLWILAVSSLETLGASASPLVDHAERSVITGAGATVTSSNGLSWYSSSLTNGTSGVKPINSYTCYAGPASQFPPMSAWVNFNTMWRNAVTYAMNASSINDTKQEIADIRTAILAVSQQAKVDARVILATILLESTGNVRVPCTVSYGGVYNCGLMQSYDAKKQVYNASAPQQSITLMIRNGVQGTAAGPGQVQYFNDASDTAEETHGNAYAVFRSYNSGSVNATNLSDGLGASNAYVSNMANYLRGWNGYGNGPSSCVFVPASSTTSTSSSSSSTSATPTPTNGGTAPPGPTQSGIPSDCDKWSLEQNGVYCQGMADAANITLAYFYQLNPGVGSQCQSLYSGYAYCVGEA